jgi:hypothetical protein
MAVMKTGQGQPGGGGGAYGPETPRRWQRWKPATDTHEVMGIETGQGHHWRWKLAGHRGHPKDVA